MDEFKAEVYMRAGAFLEEDIRQSKEALSYWQYVRVHYPFDQYGNNVYHQGFSESDVHREDENSIWTLRNEITKRPFVRIEVDNMVTKIYNKMSSVYITSHKILTISNILYDFMRITGKPIGALKKTQWSVFLLSNWGKYLIPVDEEAVWTKIPQIGAMFMHQFKLARDAGGRLPNEYPRENFHINRNMPLVEQDDDEYG